MANYIQLSKELQERIKSDRNEHWKNPNAFLDENAVRRKESREYLWRPTFVKDCEKIMHMPLYNRYADKTQVFSLYKNDDISRRSSHVQLVSRIARNIGSLLGLNVDLIEAISLGHDIGHTPFGHAGERKLNEIYNGHTGRYFNHNVHSVRALDSIYQLNLSLQTLDGIVCHNGEMELEEYRPQPYSDFETFDKKIKDCYEQKSADRKLIPSTLEACVMRVSDIIAYLGKDRQDAEKVGLFETTPTYKDSTIGTQNAEIINNMIVNIVENSYGKDYIKMDKEYFEAFSAAKKENYAIIYGNDKIDSVYINSINPMMEELYERLLIDAKNMDENSILYKHHIEYVGEYTKHYSKVDYKENDPNDIVMDYIASMTDDYFVELYKHLFPNRECPVKYIGYFDEFK